jgi:hypothetical protein
MNHSHHLTALVPSAPMRPGRSVHADAPACGCTLAAAGVWSRRTAQRGMVGKGIFNRQGRGSSMETDV